MADKTYLYRSLRLVDADVVPQLPPGAQVVIGSPTYTAGVTITTDEDNKPDLDAVMESLHYEFVAERGEEEAPGGRRDHGVLSADPTSNVQTGDTYFNSTTNRELYYDGTSFVGEPISTHLDTFPGWNTDVVVPAGVRQRTVFVTVDIAATAIAVARVEVQVKKGAGSFQKLTEEERAIGAQFVDKTSLSFPALGGETYKFVRTGNAGTTENVSAYSFTDLY